MTAMAETAPGGPLNRSGKPWLIWAAPVLLVLYACLPLAFLLMALADGEGMVFAETPDGTVLPTSLTVVLIASFSAIYVVIAFGFLRERLWARSAAAVAPVAMGVIGIALQLWATQGAIRAVFLSDWTWAAFAGATYLYLYHYGPAVRYYETLRRRRAMSS